MTDARRWWIKTAEAMNSLRVMPRILVSVYGVYCLYLVDWYTRLPSVERTTEASAFVGVVLAAFAKLCDWYMKTGCKDS